MADSSEIRFYKGKFKVSVLTRGRKHAEVVALEDIPPFAVIGQEFITIWRLLWRKPSKEVS